MAGEVCAKTVQGDSSVEFGRREHTNLVAKANVLQFESPVLWWRFYYLSVEASTCSEEKFFGISKREINPKIMITSV